MATPSPSRRERRTAELHSRIVSAALGLFAEKGFSSTTVEDITTAADVGKGTFFNYFPTKEHLLAAFGHMQISKIQNAADAASGTTLPVRDYLYKLAFEILFHPARNPAFIRALLQANLSSAPVREIMRGIHIRATELLGRIVAVGQQRGEIRKDIPALEIAQCLRQSLLGAMLVWSLYGDGSLQTRIENTVQIIWDGIAVHSDIPSTGKSPGEGAEP